MNKQEYDLWDEYKEENKAYGQTTISDIYPDDKDPKTSYFYIFGEKNSLHDKAIYKLQMILPKEYPNKRPEITFLEPIPHHCNISSAGKICLNMYDAWNGQNHHIIDMVAYIEVLLYNPNPNDGYRLTNQCKTNKDEYDKQSKEVALKSFQKYKDEL